MLSECFSRTQIWNKKLCCKNTLKLFVDVLKLFPLQYNNSSVASLVRYRQNKTFLLWSHRNVRLETRDSQRPQLRKNVWGLRVENVTFSRENTIILNANCFSVSPNIQKTLDRLFCSEKKINALFARHWVDLKCSRLTPLEVSSRNFRFPKLKMRNRGK